jgi:hypothetical protein
MKRKILIGAFALVTALAATFAFESFSGQNEAKAICVAFVNGGGANSGCCIGGHCIVADSGNKCSVELSHRLE